MTNSLGACRHFRLIRTFLITYKIFPCVLYYTYIVLLKINHYITLSAYFVIAYHLIPEQQGLGILKQLNFRATISSYRYLLFSVRSLVPVVPPAPLGTAGDSIKEIDHALMRKITYNTADIYISKHTSGLLNLISIVIG